MGKTDRQRTVYHHWLDGPLRVSSPSTGVATRGLLTGNTATPHAHHCGTHFTLGVSQMHVHEHLLSVNG